MVKTEMIITLSICILYFLSGTSGVPTTADKNGTYTTYSPNQSLEDLDELEHDVHNSSYPNDSEEDNESSYTSGQPIDDFDIDIHSTNGPPIEDQAEAFQGSTMPVNDSKKYHVIDDMIIKKDGNRAGVVNNVWPGGMVPYVFHISIGPQQRVQIGQAMTDISAATCVQFRPVRNDDTYSLMYQSDPRSQGCSSYVGFQNRKQQPIQLAAVCSHGNIVHEIIHALGFYHEQTRNDRDDFVKINFENIQSGYETNFMKDKDIAAADTEYHNVPYNYDSIMHYGKAFFSKNNLPTIDVLNNTNALGKGDNIGQRNAMSYGDVTMINTKYNCQMPTGNPIEQDMSSTAEPDANVDEGASSATTAVTTTKPNNPMCPYNPTLPGCRMNVR